jgi:hypothetical protein
MVVRLTAAAGALGVGRVLVSTDTFGVSAAVLRESRRRAEAGDPRSSSAPAAAPWPPPGWRSGPRGSRRRGYAGVGVPAEQGWLLPGFHAGRHLPPDRLQVRLNRLGIFVRDARTVAVLNLAVDVPVGRPRGPAGHQFEYRDPLASRRRRRIGRLHRWSS